eukprot:1344074-Amorphochlora_amoeboformis.AAC.2
MRDKASRHPFSRSPIFFLEKLEFANFELDDGVRSADKARLPAPSLSLPGPGVSHCSVNGFLRGWKGDRKGARHLSEGALRIFQEYHKSCQKKTDLDKKVRDTGKERVDS